MQAQDQQPARQYPQQQYQTSNEDTLQVALKLVDALKSENETIKSELEKFRTCNKGQNALQKKIGEIESHWKGQLEAKTTELKKKNAVDPKEIDLLRIQISTEIESSCEKRLRKAEDDAEKLKAILFSLKRENEIMREDSISKDNTHSSIIRDLQSSHMDEIASFEQKIKELQGNIDLLGDSDQLHSLQRESMEQALRIQSLTSEIEEVRSKKEMAAVEYEQRERILNRRFLEESSNSKSIRIEKEALQVKINSLQEEISSLKKSYDSATEDAAASKKEILKMKSLLEETKHQSSNSVELNETKVSHLKAVKNLDIQISDMKSKLLDESINLKTAKETIQSIRTKLTENEKAAAQAVIEARDEEQSKLNKLVAEKAAVEHQLLELNKAMDQIRNSEAAAKHSLEEEVARLQRIQNSEANANNSLKAENKALQSELHKLQAQFATEQTRAKDLEKKIQITASEKQQTDHEIDVLNTRILHLEESLQGARMEAVQKDENLLKEEQAFKHNLELCRNTWAREKEKMRAQMELLSAENIRLSDNEHALRKASYVRGTQS
ncbi:Centrosomal protein of 83 kDa [Entophlyctis sp. JEL0112]|nr:Centrosomal protein of 83 kDa [Entophlyctis sp. JEL0112]